MQRISFNFSFLSLVLFFTFISIDGHGVDNHVLLDSLTKGKTPVEQYQSVYKEVHHYNTENLHSRLFFSRALLNIAETIGDTVKLGHAWYELAFSYEIIGQLELATEACFKALKYSEAAQDSLYIGYTYNELGLIFSAGYDPTELHKSIQYFNRFLTIQKARKDTAEIAGALSNIGLIYIFLEKYDSAYYYSKKGLDLRQQIQQKRTIPISLGNVGVSLYGLGKYEEALNYFLQTEKIYTSNGNLYGLNETYISLITYYIYKKNAAKTKEFVDKYAANARKINSLLTTRKSYYSYYQYYKLIKNYDLALENFEQYKVFSDSMNNEKTKDRMANVEAVYQINEKENQIALMKQKEAANQLEKDVLKQQTRFYLSLVFSILFLLVALVIGSYLKRKKDREIIRQKQLILEKEKALTESELEKSRLKEEELNTQLEYKSKQLTSHALNMMQKNKFLQEVEKDVSEISKKSGDETKQKLRMLNRSIKRMNKSDKDWDLFRNYFEEVNTGFYQRLGERFPGLSGNDYKLLALIKLNMNIKESASILNISPDSVKTARYRLRKKLNISQETDLYQFVQDI